MEEKITQFGKLYKEEILKELEKARNLIMGNVIEIIVKKYDENNNIVFIEKQGKSIWSILSLMQFEDDMEYWDMPTYIVEIDGRKGFLFNKKIKKENLVSEIQRFIDDHKLNERNCLLD